MLEEMMGKLQEMQNQMQASQKKLDELLVESSQAGGQIKVVCTASKMLKDIIINEEFLKHTDKEEIEDLILLTVNEALAKAETIAQEQMTSFGNDLLPDGLKGLF